MFKKGLKWLKKATKEDATVAVEKKLYDGFPVYWWNRETNDVKIIDTFATRELALASAKYLKNFYKDVVVMDQYGKIVEML